MRIHRDTRFSRDKSPYKTNVGIHFRHMLGKDVHAPGFYIHIEPGDCFLGVGIWRPDGPTVQKIRQAIVSDPAKWKRVRDNKRFRSKFELEGDRLRSAPRGYDKGHPLIEDLKRKDFIAVCRLSQQDVLAEEFIDQVALSFTRSGPYMRFLCEALVIPF